MSKQASYESLGPKMTPTKAASRTIPDNSKELDELRLKIKNLNEDRSKLEKEVVGKTSKISSLEEEVDKLKKQ
jgi:chromosome segregation ATPase